MQKRKASLTSFCRLEQGLQSVVAGYGQKEDGNREKQQPRESDAPRIALAL